jgi:hypothetical protein
MKQLNADDLIIEYCERIISSLKSITESLMKQ